MGGGESQVYRLGSYANAELAALAQELAAWVDHRDRQEIPSSCSELTFSSVKLPGDALSSSTPRLLWLAPLRGHQKPAPESWCMKTVDTGLVSAALIIPFLFILLAVVLTVWGIPGLLALGALILWGLWAVDFVARSLAQALMG
jgi:small-conductance mechanosensitive channel